MWLMTQEGFYSIVKHKTLKDTFMVRSRERSDIENLLRLCKLKLAIVETPQADYPCRIIVTGAQKDAIALKLAAGINYSNFKDRVHQRKDQARKGTAYMSIWSTMRRTETRANRPLWESPMQQLLDEHERQEETFYMNDFDRQQEDRQQELLYDDPFHENEAETADR